MEDLYEERVQIEERDQMLVLWAVVGTNYKYVIYRSYLLTLVLTCQYAPLFCHTSAMPPRPSKHRLHSALAKGQN